MGSIEVYPAIMYPLWNIIRNVYRYLIKIIFHKWFIIAGYTGVGKHFNFFYNKLFRVTRTRCQVSRSRYVIYSQESYKLKLINKTAEPKQIHRKQGFVVIIIPIAHIICILQIQCQYMICYFAQKIESVNIIFSLSISSIAILKPMQYIQRVTKILFGCFHWF